MRANLICKGLVHTSVCGRKSLEGIFSPSFQFASEGDDASLGSRLVYWEQCVSEGPTDFSFVAASWLVISVVIVQVSTEGGEGRTGGQVL
jgi:hypothetical protein